MNRRALLLASALALPPLLLSPKLPLHVADAQASVAKMLSLDELVAGSTYVVVATAGERRSVWEDLPSGKRIVTYTKLSVERPVVGAPGAEIWVRTLGGVVGKIGQAVPGEAQIASGSRGLFFLAQANGVVVVTAMGQGHYPIVSDDKGVARVSPPPDPGLLVRKPGPTISAHEQIVGGTLEAAVTLVQQAKKARDAQK
jgi:hypothetical protein